MLCLTPIDVTDTVLIASSLTEADYPVWSDTGEYTGPPAPGQQGERVIRTETHRVYEALQNVGPSATPPEDDPDNWLDVSATNKWQPFDYYLADQATGDNISYTLAPASAVTSLLVFNTRCDSIDVVVTRDGNTLMDENISMSELVTPTDFFTWIMGVPEPVPEIPIPLTFLPGSEIEITFNGTDVAVGQIVLGVLESWGMSTYDTSFELMGFSTIAPDKFGKRKIVRRDSTFDFRFHVVIPPARVTMVKKRVKEAQGRTRAYLGTPDAKHGSMVLGVMANMGLDYSNPGLSNYTLQIEGLV